MQRRIILDVVGTHCTTALELFSGKNQALLLRENAFPCLDLRLDGVNGIAGLHIERNGLSGEELDVNHYTSTDADSPERVEQENQVVGEDFHGVRMRFLLLLLCQTLEHVVANIKGV